MHLTTHASNDASPPEFKKLLHIFFPIGPLAHKARWQQVMPDDHSEVEPLLPIPNRTVKRFSADDSAATRVKVGHRQATLPQKASSRWPFAFGAALWRIGRLSGVSPRIVRRSHALASSPPRASPQPGDCARPVIALRGIQKPGLDPRAFHARLSTHRLSTRHDSGDVRI